MRYIDCVKKFILKRLWRNVLFKREIIKYCTTVEKKNNGIGKLLCTWTYCIKLNDLQFMLSKCFVVHIYLWRYRGKRYQ